MKTTFFSITAIAAVTAMFITLNNIPQIPWEITKYLWYAFLPCCTGAIAFAYGLTARRSGGGILLAAAIIIPLLYLSTKHTLPFASTLTALPSIITAALLPLPAEICGRNTRRKRKKRSTKGPAPQI